jgi:PPIC-type peptidyl-prolyl cis-trans isomerase-like protein/parvulin-like peptidyl-prolyl cis-trans isomerase-like protein
MIKKSELAMLNRTIFALFAVLLLLQPSLGNTFTERKATDDEVDAYFDLFQSSVIRNLGFSNEIDPQEVIREEILIEARLAMAAMDTDIASDKRLMADIYYYQTKVILDKWLQSVYSPPEVCDEEIEAYYKEHSAEFLIPEKAAFRSIFFMVPEGSGEEVAKEKEELAAKLHKMLKRGADFSTLAIEYSDQKGVENKGGLIGPVEVEKLNPMLSGKIRALKEDEISEPFKTPYGWMIIQLMERSPVGTIPLSDVRMEIIDNLARDRFQPGMDKMMAEINDAFPAVINEDILNGDGEISEDEEAKLIEIGGKKYSVSEVVSYLLSIHTFNAKNGLREMLKNGLPRFIATHQVVRRAEKDGFLEKPQIKNQMLFWRNRLLAQKYRKLYMTKRVPTDADLKEHYNDQIESFSYPARVRGKRIIWNLKNAEGKSESQLAFLKSSLMLRIDDILKSYRKGDMSLDKVKKSADDVADFGWVEPGPSGYQADMAYFNTEAGDLSKPFWGKNVLIAAFIKEAVKEKPKPFVEVKEDVNRSLLNRWSQEDRKKLIQDILKEYALLPESR